MEIKIYISLFFVLLFGGKLFIVDTGALEFLSDGEISVTTPYCKKKGEVDNKQKTTDFKQQVDSQTQFLSFNSFCSPQFKLELTNWDVCFQDYTNTKEKIFISRLSYIYLDHHSPPPKLA